MSALCGAGGWHAARPPPGGPALPPAPWAYPERRVLPRACREPVLKDSPWIVQAGRIGGRQGPRHIACSGNGIYRRAAEMRCHSSGVEHFIGNEEVQGSIPCDSTTWRMKGCAQVAQLVEHATENRSVTGSIPVLGTISASFCNAHRIIIQKCREMRTKTLFPGMAFFLG